MYLFKNKLTDIIQARVRKNRFALFKSLISPLTRPIKMLDVGGTEQFWLNMGYTDEKDIQVTLLNLVRFDTKYSNFRSIIGNATDLSEFKDQTSTDFEKVPILK